MTDKTHKSGINIADVVVRDEKGRRVPKEVYVAELEDTVVSKPMSKSAQERYLMPIAEQAQVMGAIADGEIDVEELDEEEQEELQSLGLKSGDIAELFDSHLVEPDLTEFYYDATDGEKEALDAEFIDEWLDPKAEVPLFYAVLLASGLDELVAEHRKTVDDEDLDVDADVEDESEEADEDAE